MIRPRSRRRGLIVRDLGDEVVVYDRFSHRSHCLNRLAALVFRACNGRRSIPDIARRVARELEAPVGEESVRLALRKLSRAGLLDSREAVPSISRRAAVRRLSAGLVPIVVSMLAPTPSEAASPGCATNCLIEPNGTTCYDGIGCNGICCNGFCAPPGPC